LRLDLLRQDLPQSQPMLNQRYAATEREQTPPIIAKFINVFIFVLINHTAHNGLVAGSNPAGLTNKSITYRIFISAGPGITAPETPHFVACYNPSAVSKLLLHSWSGYGFSIVVGGLIGR
jgi:hypothetical protein